MNVRTLAWVVCPVCHSRLVPHAVSVGSVFEIEEGALRCPTGHEFPVVRGVPRLISQTGARHHRDGHSIRESFSREWRHFEYRSDRTWGQTVAERRQDFLRHVDLTADALRDMVVLDAGCGNGVLSAAISTFECEVLATDISDGVVSAHRHLRSERTHYVQSDLMNLAVREGIFDVVYCAGVLHHTPSTRATLGVVVRAVAPGGRIFIWLYWKESGFRARVSEAIRRVLAPLPASMKHLLVGVGLLPQAVLRQWLGAVLGRRGRLNWREIFVRQLDSYTPRYRWVHTPNEVRQWFQELGLEDVKVTEEGTCGFGVVARKPMTVVEASADRLVVSSS